jgi:acyl-CoA synthetase (NDP forming)
MLTQEMKDILSASREIGWVMEPQAKGILSSIGLEVPQFLSTSQIEEAIRFAKEIGYPIVAKVVSPKIIHMFDARPDPPCVDS